MAFNPSYLKQSKLLAAKAQLRGRSANVFTECMQVVRLRLEAAEAARGPRAGATEVAELARGAWPLAILPPLLWLPFLTPPPGTQRVTVAPRRLEEGKCYTSTLTFGLSSRRVGPPVAPWQQGVASANEDENARGIDGGGGVRGAGVRGGRGRASVSTRPSKDIKHDAELRKTAALANEGPRVPALSAMKEAFQVAVTDARVAQAQSLALLRDVQRLKAALQKPQEGRCHRDAPGARGGGGDNAAAGEGKGEGCRWGTRLEQLALEEKALAAELADVCRQNKRILQELRRREERYGGNGRPQPAASNEALDLATDDDAGSFSASPQASPRAPRALAAATALPDLVSPSSAMTPLSPTSPATPRRTKGRPVSRVVTTPRVGGPPPRGGGSGGVGGGGGAAAILPAIGT